jgi:hypothetical protein
VSEVLRRDEIIALEQQHARGYDSRPQTLGEVGEWEDEQVWDEHEPEPHLKS